MKRKNKRPQRDASPAGSGPRNAPPAPRGASQKNPPRPEKSAGPKTRLSRSGRKRPPREKAHRHGAAQHPFKPALPDMDPPPLASHETPPAGFDAERSPVEQLDLGDTDVSSEEAFELGIGSRIVPPTTQYGEAFESTPPPSERAQGDVEAQIRALEARLDGLIRRREFSEPDAEDEEEELPASRAREPLAKAPVAAPVVVEPAPQAVEADFISRKWGRAALRSRSEEFDDFGLDPGFEKRVTPLVEFLYRSYFRTTVEGIENVPAEGRCIVVANHSGALPLDGPMLRAALRIEHSQKRDLRWLAEDFIYYLPFAGVFMNRVGAVRACPENAERLLGKENLVAVFPEGVHGIKKLFRDRYHLQRFGRGGYIRLCLRMGAPIVPCAIIGAEESSPLLYRLEGLTELLGLPYFPITPTFPWLGPMGLLPAPSKWRMRFGEPIHFDSYGPEAADDHVLVGRLSERVRSSIQAMLDSGLRERRSVWFG